MAMDRSWSSISATCCRSIVLCPRPWLRPALGIVRTIHNEMTTVRTAYSARAGFAKKPARSGTPHPRTGSPTKRSTPAATKSALRAGLVSRSTAATVSERLVQRAGSVQAFPGRRKRARPGRIQSSAGETPDAGSLARTPPALFRAEGHHVPVGRVWNQSPAFGQLHGRRHPEHIGAGLQRADVEIVSPRARGGFVYRDCRRE